MVAKCVTKYAAENGISEEAASEIFMDPATAPQFRPCIEAELARLQAEQPDKVAANQVVKLGPVTTLAKKTDPAAVITHLALPPPPAPAPSAAPATDALAMLKSPKVLLLMAAAAVGVFLLVPGKRSVRANASGSKRPMTPSYRKALISKKRWATKIAKKKAAAKAKLASNCRCNGSNWTPAQRKVGGAYGSPMGRRSDSELTGKLHLRRVRLDRGGYDTGGAYWGVGAPLWVAWDDDGNERYLRARDRDAAKRELPGYKFYKN
jgi:hypothetical protein